MSDLFILCAGIALGQVIRIHVSPEHLAIAHRAIAAIDWQGLERTAYRLGDALGITSPTKRLDAYFEQLAQDGAIDLADVAPTADEVTLTSAAKRITAASKARSTRVKIDAAE
jgi:hypothetical protein